MPVPLTDTPAIDTQEAQLLLRCRAGDRAAFEALISPHLPAARAFATRLLGNLDDGEDAVQDALFKTWTRLDTFQGHRGRFRSWFLRIVFNQCTDARRRATTRRAHEERVRPTTPPPVSARLEQRELLAAVNSAIDQLPPRQAAVLHLRVVEELSYAEIADVLGLTAGTARVYVVRARTALRDRLGLDHPDVRLP